MAAGGESGVLWRLAESGRQLDANFVRLPAEQRIDVHVEPEVDVLLLVVTGEGSLSGADSVWSLTPGALVWLPRGCSRSLAAGAQGLTYLTTHTRRPGLQIRMT